MKPVALLLLTCLLGLLGLQSPSQSCSAGLRNELPTLVECTHRASSHPLAVTGPAPAELASGNFLPRQNVVSLGVPCEKSLPPRRGLVSLVSKRGPPSR